ncbi:tyrosine-type recombinase/integrase [Lysinibacillus boronitolerans]|uniref:tyrosine-type recombinase/integrase n=1 Tax=Lysinibacillus boronitolerans TaxID=309788 RepID=UPI00030AC16F|nr:tyrosine-type recombinase/integrase [Lysinibacillus boronitolerans]
MEIGILQAFEQWLMEDGRAASTVQSYMNDVQKFNRYLVERDADPEILLSRFYFTSYLKQLEAEGMKVNTINKKITSLKVYNDWLVKQGYVTESFVQMKRDKIRIANGSEDEVSVLNDFQVDQFLFHLEKESQRNKCIGYLLLYTGVRVSELVQIQISDIDRLAAQLTVRGKGGKYRQIPLRKDVLKVIHVYLQGERGGSFPESPYLLVSQRAEKMHRDAVRRWLEQVGEALNVHIHPHMLRHTFCTRLLKNGVDITTVSKLAGHANLNTTIKHYINISKEEKQHAVERL